MRILSTCVQIYRRWWRYEVRHVPTIYVQTRTMSTSIWSYRRLWCYELRNVPKVLCTNEDYIKCIQILRSWWHDELTQVPMVLHSNENFIHVYTDLEMMMTLWIKKCVNCLCYELRHVPKVYAWTRTVSTCLQSKWRWCRYELRHVLNAEKKANI